MINALKLCRIWFITQPELAREGEPSPAVVLCCRNQQAQLNFIKDKPLSKPSLTKNSRSQDMAWGAFWSHPQVPLWCLENVRIQVNVLHCRRNNLPVNWRERNQIKYGFSHLKHMALAQCWPPWGLYFLRGSSVGVPVALVICSFHLLQSTVIIYWIYFFMACYCIQVQ